ncbi:hypothetical protein BH09ACT10_BH09ACT10_01960 [soil metagenome]
MRVVGIAALGLSVAIGLGAVDSTFATEPVSPTATTATPTPAQAANAPETGGAVSEASAPQATTVANGVVLESTFARPIKGIASYKYRDYTLLEDMNRLIGQSYKGKSKAQRKKIKIRITISRMENSTLIRNALVKASRAGVDIRIIHGVDSQSKESKYVQRNVKKGQFKICKKGKSHACLSTRRGAIAHTKMLLISETKTRSGDVAKNVVWTSSSNLGGPSGAQTYNNALTIYNDPKLFVQMQGLFDDMWHERSPAGRTASGAKYSNDYLEWLKEKARYAASHPGTTASKAGNAYARSQPAKNGMFYSKDAKTTIYVTPIKATPSNGKDPVMAALNRVIPGDDCRIRVMHNRFKYRRLAVAQKLVQLANDGCKVSVIAFEDDLKVNRTAHCQLYIRICRPILDEFRTANDHIEVAWAKPHDKTMLIEARMKPNKLNPEEPAPDPNKPVTLVQAGSAALTGSNLVDSDELTTENTDEIVYADYLQHWKAIWKSRDHKNYAY